MNVSFVRMIHRLATFLLFSLTLLSPSSAQDQEATPPSIKELTAQVRDSLVIVSQLGRDGVDRGLGSGFIISDDGLIATCNHVIGESRELKVTLANGEEFAATAVHAWDRKLDLAVLRIDPGKTKLQAIELGDSDELAEGQRIVTIGNPHGLAFSVVEGLVSAIRELEEGGPPMIQVAIPVEPGNSGGPLIDLEGKVVGIVSMKSTVTDNIGFASPSNTLKPLLEKPNTVLMKNWVTIGALDPQQWRDTMGARWRQRAGRITADSPGKGFGGRSLCLAQREVPGLPYEIEVSVRLDDESGAAGLAFESDGGDVHYGFYPSNGQLRLTRFDGADVYSWNVLKQLPSKDYKPGEWNHLRVRIDEKTIVGFINGERLFEIEEHQLRGGGKAGLAKFRQTRAEFKGFRLGRDLSPAKPAPELLAKLNRQLVDLDPSPAKLDKLSLNATAARELLTQRREELTKELEALEQLNDAIHRKDIERRILTELEKEDEPDIDLINTSLLIALLDNPEIDLTSYTQEVERITAGAKAAIESSAAKTDREKLEMLSVFLFEQSGFHGSRSAYYSRSNSYLNEVIDDREGIPITLSVLYIELAKRLGVGGVKGLGLPGHFVVVHEAPGGEEKTPRQIIDVFDRGKFVSEDEAARLVGLIPALGESVDQYKISTKRQIITRMLTNLKGIAIEEQSPLEALRYIDLLVAINPDDAPERLSRALLLAQAEKPERAIPDLEWIFEKEPEGIDLDRLREFYEHLKRQ
ncbi:MAG: serine protease Do [Verrucomicrobiales bacterium]|jgi:serine protease Do